MEWKTVKLGDWMEFNPKRTIHKNNMARKITMDMLIPYEKHISKYIFEPYSGGAKFQNGDTIMARITPCLENGKHAFVSCLNPGEIAYGSTEYFVLCGKEGVSDNDFVYYLTHTPLFKDTAIKSMVGSSGRQRAQIDVLQNLEMLVPASLADQKRIAAILSSLDAKIENNNRINANLEAQAQALYKSWFVDFEPWDGVMPEDWKEGKLGDYVTVKRGGSPRPIQAYLSTEGYRWLKISDATAEQSPFICKIVEHIKKEGLNKTVFLEKGNLVLSNSATPGLPKFLELDTCIHDGWLYFPKSYFPKEFLYLLFQREREYLISQGNGSVFTNLKTEIVKNLSVIVPPTDILTKFQNIAYAIFEQIKKNCQESQRLAQLRDTLLPKLMKGEIEV